MINKDTQICISISSDPSNFGTTFHNLGYKTQGLNFLYKAVQVSDLPGAMAGVRALNIAGCSVSMPFKQTVLQYIDALDSSASHVQAVNTVLQKKGHLTGYNTDYSGVLSILQMLELSRDKKVIVAGMGGVARAHYFAFNEYGCKEIAFKARDLNKAKKNAAMIDPGCSVVEWLNGDRADILINATPLGMKGHSDVSPFTEQQITNAELVFDLVISQENTKLVDDCLKFGTPVLPGHVFSLEQLCHQYRIYTCVDAPRTLFVNKIKALFPNFDLSSITALYIN